MRILVLSDTHGNYPLAVHALDMIPDLDAVIHLGDGEGDMDVLPGIFPVQMIAVRGNCDLSSTLPRELVVELAGKRLLLTHGDAYGVKGGMIRLEKRAREAAADAVLYGHTHSSFIETINNILFINPGTLMNGALFQCCCLMDITPDGIHTELISLT